MPVFKLRSNPDRVSGMRRVLFTQEIARSDFKLGEFLGKAASRNSGKPGYGEIPDLADADLDDLRTQVVAAGIQTALTLDGRLNLRGWKLENAQLSGLRATMADMEGASFTRSVMDGVMMDGSRLRSVKMLGVSIREASFRKADLTKVEIGPAPIGTRNLPVGLMPQDGAAKSELPTRARSAHFEGARIDEAELTDVDFSHARFQGATLLKAVIVTCDFTEADLTKADLSDAKMSQNKLRTGTACLAVTRGAKLWANNYLPQIAVKDFISLRPDLKLDGLVGKEEERLRKMPREMRADYELSLALTIAAIAAAAAASAFVMDSSAMTLAMGAAGGGLGRYVAVHNITHKIAHTAAEKVIDWTGMAREAASKLVETIAGRLALVSVGEGGGPLVRAARKPEMLGRAATFELGDGLNVVISSARNIDDILAASGAYASEFGSLNRGVVLIRRIGGTYPDETAPSKVRFREDGACQAVWDDTAGKPFKMVEYDRTGTPLRISDCRGEPPHPASAETDPFFSRPRSAIAEFRDCLTRSCVPHNGQTHIASLQNDGTIIVRSISSKKVDNEIGRAAVRKPDGTALGFRDGVLAGNLLMPAREMAGTRAP